MIIILIIILIFYLTYKQQKCEEHIDFKPNKDIMILKNFYNPKKLSKIKKMLSYLKLKVDTRLRSRKSICLDKNYYPEIYRLIYQDKKLKRYINLINTDSYKIFPDFPIEYREYPNNSNGMDWHQDVSMFKPDCLELILTLENNSNSKFMWLNNKNEVKTINTLENMLIIVKPNTVYHKVSNVNGNRKILKFIVQFQNSKKKNTFYKQLNKCPK